MKGYWFQSRRGKVVVALGLMACAAVFLFRGAKPGSDVAARDVLGDLLDGRGASVYRLATPEERAHLSREQWAKVYAMLVKPRLDQYRTAGKLDADSSGESGSWGSAYTLFREPQGKTMSTGVTIWMTEQGETAPTAITCLALAWRLEWFGQHGSDFRSDGLARAYLAGLRKDRPTLESLGLKGFYMSPHEGFLTWDQLDKRWATRAAKAERGGA